MSTVIPGAVGGASKEKIWSQLKSRYYAATEELRRLYRLDDYMTAGMKLKSVTYDIVYMQMTTELCAARKLIRADSVQPLSGEGISSSLEQTGTQLGILFLAKGFRVVSEVVVKNLRSFEPWTQIFLTCLHQLQETQLYSEIDVYWRFFCLRRRPPIVWGWTTQLFYGRLLLRFTVHRLAKFC